MALLAPDLQAVRVDLKLDTLTDFTGTWIFKLNGNAVDLADFAFVSQIRPTANDPTLLLDLADHVATTAQDGTLVLGEFRLFIPASDIRSLGVEEAAWDLGITSVSKGNYKLMYGHVEVVQSVTKVS